MLDPQGYQEAVAAVEKMSGQELFAYLDTMYGRDDLPRSCTIEDIRNEALAQTERKFTEMTQADLERHNINKKAAFRAALVPGRNAPK